MSNLLAARSLMALSLGFHIIFANVGMAMPLLMILDEWRWLKTGQEVYLTLAKRWAKGTAIFFAIWAVTRTVLSFYSSVYPWGHRFRYVLAFPSLLYLFHIFKSRSLWVKGSNNAK